MTAVDHAELKRRMDGVLSMLDKVVGPINSVRIYEHEARAIINTHAALLSEIEGLKAERDTAQSAVEAWAHVCESLEAHLQDRVAMRDEANPERYLSILRSNMARVQRDSEQIRAARWADYRRTQAPDSWRPDRAIQDIVAERQRQQSVEGWSTGHDDEHNGGELAKAAACYAAGKIVSAIPTEIDPDRGAAGYRSVWPWDMTWWKPKTYRHNLIRAAALLVAEIERLDRRAALRPQTAESGK